MPHANLAGHICVVQTHDVYVKVYVQDNEYVKRYDQFSSSTFNQEYVQAVRIQQYVQEDQIIARSDHI